MLVIGFVVAFAGVGNPRLVGSASAFQLFYILASFPPNSRAPCAATRRGRVRDRAARRRRGCSRPDPVTLVPAASNQAADGVAALRDATAETVDPPAAWGDRDSRRSGRTTWWPPSSWAATHRSGPPPRRAFRTGPAHRRRSAGGARRGGPAGDGRPAGAGGDLAAEGVLRWCRTPPAPRVAASLPGPRQCSSDGLDTAVGRAETAYPVGGGDGRDTSDVPRLCRDATALALADQVRSFAEARRPSGRGTARGRDLGALRVRATQPVEAVLVAVPLPPGTPLGPPAQLDPAGGGARPRSGRRRGVAPDPRLLGAAGHPHGPAYLGLGHPHRAAAGRAGHDRRCRAAAG